MEKLRLRDGIGADDIAQIQCVGVSPSVEVVDVVAPHRKMVVMVPPAARRTLSLGGLRFRVCRQEWWLDSWPPSI